MRLFQAVHNTAQLRSYVTYYSYRSTEVYPSTGNCVCAQQPNLLNQAKGSSNRNTRSPQISPSPEKPKNA